MGGPAASAQTTAYYPGGAEVRIGVAASIDGSCGFVDGQDPQGSYNQPSFDTSGFTHDFAFALTCTTPLRVAVVSANGGLRAAGAVTPGYAGLAPYQVTLNLVGDASTVVQATCSAATLRTGTGCTFLGPASATQGLYLPVTATGQAGSYLRVSATPAPQSLRLISGAYSDTLVITLSASP